MSQVDRIDWVDVGRGVAIVLVVLFHTTNWLAVTGLDLQGWVAVNAILSGLRIPMFFMLSGLFAAKWIAAPWSALLRTKILLFVWVLLVWSVIDMAVQLAGLAAAGQAISFRTAAKDLLLSPIVPLFELWFIWALALFFLVAKATRRLSPGLQLAISGVLSAVALTVWIDTTTGLTGGIKFYFFFLSGLYLRRIFISFAAAPVWAGGAAILAWAIIAALIFLLDLRALPGVYFVNCVAGVFAGVALSRFLARVGLLRMLGGRTMPIYLTHTPVVILMLIVLLTVPPVMGAASAVAPILPALVAAIAITAALGLERWSRSGPLGMLYEPPRIAVRVLRGRGRDAR